MGIAGSLKIQGYTIVPVKGLKMQRKATYYHPRTGEPCVLPADDYHKPRYLKRGFTLEPPEAKPKPELPKGAGKCPVCGKTCKRVRQHYNLIH